MLINLNDNKQLKKCFDEVINENYEPQRDLDGNIVIGCICEVISEVMSGFMVYYCKKCGKIIKIIEVNDNEYT